MQSHDIDTVYLKSIQGGGSSEAVLYAAESYSSRTVIFVVENLDVQVTQVSDRLKEAGVPAEFIYAKAEQIRKYKSGTPGILIVNKHASSLNAAINAISGVKTRNLGIFDEPDRDALGHETSDKVPKDILVNKLRNLCSEREHITASILSLVISNINYTHTIEIPKEKGYLSFEDLHPVCLGDEDVSEMLKSGNLSPTLKNFIIENAEEGILIRVDHEVEDMALAKKTIEQLVDVPVAVLNGTNKIDPKTFKGVLISFKMAERGVTFPHLWHMILDFSSTAFQNAVVQAFRVLGYGKCSATKNKFAANIFSIERSKTAFELENKLQEIMRKYHNNYQKRWEEVEKLEFKYHWRLLGKSNKFGVRQQSFIKKEEFPYTKELEEFLIREGKLFYRIVQGNGDWYRGGGRSRERAFNDIINNAPHSPSWLDKPPLQKISPQYSVQRLKSIEFIKDQTIQWGFIFDHKTGKPIKLVLWEKLEESSAKYRYIRNKNVETKNRTAA